MTGHSTAPLTFSKVVNTTILGAPLADLEKDVTEEDGRGERGHLSSVLSSGSYWTVVTKRDLA